MDDGVRRSYDGGGEWWPNEKLDQINTAKKRMKTLGVVE